MLAYVILMCLGGSQCIPFPISFQDLATCQANVSYLNGSALSQAVTSRCEPWSLVPSDKKS
jgi:hypothetical protein